MRISDWSSDVCSSDLRAAARAKCDLIITGVARDETLGRLILGSTVNHLARKTTVPLLIVRDRPFRPYDRLLVATDFSPSARVSLVTCISFFPAASITLFHAYVVPFAGSLARSEVEREFETYGEIGSASCRERVCQYV